MKKKVLGRIISIICVLTIVLGAVPVGALQFPNSNLPMLGVGSPVQTSSGKGSSLVRKGKEISFTAPLRGGTQTFYLAFPSFGGIRLRTKPIIDSTSAVFEPDSYLNITNSGTTLNAGDMAVTYISTSNGWQLSFKRANGSDFILSSEDIVFGYEDSGYRNAIIYNGDLSTGEVIFGSGQRFSGFNLVGQDFNIWNNDGYSGGDETAEHTLSYVNVPIFHSSTGYSIYFNTFVQGMADIGKSDSSKYTVNLHEPGGELDMFLWNGTAAENLESYTSLTGKPVTVPKWALKYWIGSTKNVWGNDDPYYSYRAETRLKEVLDKYKAYGTMPSAIYGEGYPGSHSESYEQVQSYGVRMIRWNYPGISLDTIKSLLPDLAEDALPVVKNSDGTYYENYVDYSSPDALRLIKEIYKDYFSWGLKGAMVDYGEYIPWNVNNSIGMSGLSMHNGYSYYYAKTMNTAFKEGLGNNDYLLFARAGAAGSQAEAASFTGDQPATFAGMRQQLSALLSMSASGYSVIGGDIGGHFSENNAKIPDNVYKRWLEFGTFQPMMRTHGGIYLDRTRDPWNYGAETMFKKHYWLRENISDLVYSASLNAAAGGNPMVQAFAVAFPNDTAVHSVEDQYMFCEGLMVAPVLEDGAVSRDVVFPKGNWYSFYDGGRVTGDGSAKNVSADIDTIPVYVKAGAVVPLKLSNSLKLSEAIDEATAVKALLIAQPDNDTGYTYSDENGKTVYTLDKRIGEYIISSDKVNSTKTLILYGGQPGAVFADGAEVDKANITYDGENRTVISLTDNWTEISLRYSDYDPDGRIKISNATELSNIGVVNDMPSNESYVLTQDISVTEDWSGISEFSGIFDGDGHTITGLKNSLFASLTGDAQVKNLILSNGYMDYWWTYHKGSVTDAVIGKDGVKLSNIAVVNYVLKGNTAGAFAGTADNANLTIEYCSYNGEIDTQGYCGGYVSRVTNGSLTIKDSYVETKGYIQGGLRTYSADDENDTVLKNGTIEDAWYYRTDGSGSNDTGKRDLTDLGFSTEYWVHDGNRPQLKITGALQYVKGDANSDRTVDVRDLIRLKKATVGTAEIALIAANVDTSTNINGEAVLDSTDLATLAKIIIK